TPMRDTRLILIEGLPGSGKSTTAQWLCHLLEGSGVAARWFHEQDTHHPVYRYDELQAAARRSASDCGAYHAHARVRWSRLAGRLTGGGDIPLLDGSFLQTPLVSMQLAGCDAAAISAHVREVERLVSAARPTLILLRQADTAAAFERMRGRRGPEF